MGKKVQLKRNFEKGKKAGKDLRNEGVGTRVIF